MTLSYLQEGGVLQGVLLGGKHWLQDFVVGTPQIEFTSSEMSQLTFTVSDPDFRLMREGVFTLGAAMDLSDYILTIAAVETGGDTDAPTVQVTARSRGVLALKNRTGAYVVSDVSPTEFARREAQSVGMKFVGQDTAKQPQIGRNEQKDGEEPESSWDVIERLAGEAGFVVFEARNTLYFGAPTWLIGQGSRHTINYPQDTFGVPTCRRAEKAKPAVTIEVTVSQEKADDIRPGDVVAFGGVPGFEGDYMVTSVPITLDGVTPVSISIATPTDPEKKELYNADEADPFGMFDDTPQEMGAFDPSDATASGTGAAGGVAGPFAWPAAGRVTSKFGPRTAPKAGASSFHRGIDIGAAEGVPVYAAKAGKVRVAGPLGGGAGNAVIIDHGGGEETRYFHLSRIIASTTARTPGYRAPGNIDRGMTGSASAPGWYEKGQLIGYVGSTGNVTGPHLHFEIWRRGEAIDPLLGDDVLPYQPARLGQANVRVQTV